MMVIIVIIIIIISIIINQVIKVSLPNAKLLCTIYLAFI